MLETISLIRLQPSAMVREYEYVVTTLVTDVVKAIRVVRALHPHRQGPGSGTHPLDCVFPLLKLHCLHPRPVAWHPLDLCVASKRTLRGRPHSQ